MLCEVVQQVVYHRDMSTVEQHRWGASHFSIIWCKNICKALIRLDKLWLLKYSINHESNEHKSEKILIIRNKPFGLISHTSTMLVSWRPVDICFSIPLLRSFPPSGKDSLLESYISCCQSVLPSWHWHCWCYASSSRHPQKIRVPLFWGIRVNLCGVHAASLQCETYSWYDVNR